MNTQSNTWIKGNKEYRCYRLVNEDESWIGEKQMVVIESRFIGWRGLLSSVWKEEARHEIPASAVFEMNLEGKTNYRGEFMLNAMEELDMPKNLDVFHTIPKLSF